MSLDFEGKPKELLYGKEPINGCLLVDIDIQQFLVHFFAVHEDALSELLSAVFFEQPEVDIQIVIQTSEAPVLLDLPQKRCRVTLQLLNSWDNAEFPEVVRRFLVFNLPEQHLVRPEFIFPGSLLPHQLLYLVFVGRRYQFH